MVTRDWSASRRELRDLHDLLTTLRQLRRMSIEASPDGRHRPEMMGIFSTDTGRNAPSTDSRKRRLSGERRSTFVFAPARWVRGLIKPARDMAVTYSDYSAQEVAIAAKLSGDPNLLAAVESGDPYIWFAKRAGLAPTDATKRTHADLREMLKPFFLGTSYGMGSASIARRLGVSWETAEHVLLERHRRLFARYWEWVHTTICDAAERGEITSRWGWRMTITGATTRRTLQNHPVQCMGAHVLQMAAIGLVETGIPTCSLIHDAVLTECSASEVAEHARAVRAVMREASEVALGMPIEVDSKVVSWPDRYMDGRGRAMFERVMKLLVKPKFSGAQEAPGVEQRGISPIFLPQIYIGY
jgi:hypothetical protein